MKAMLTTLSPHLHGEGNFLYLNIHMEREQPWPHLSLPHLSPGISLMNTSESLAAVFSPCKRVLPVLPRSWSWDGWQPGSLPWGMPARRENKTQRTSLDIAQCLWRKAGEGAGLCMGRASEDKLAGRTTLVTQLTGRIGCSGGRTS